MFQLVILLFALVVGYWIKRLPLSNNSLNKLLFFIVVAILFVMGYDFGVNLKELIEELVNIVLMVVVFTSLIFFCNFVCASIVFRKENKQCRDNLKNGPQVSTNYLLYILQSAKYIGIIFLGIICGVILQKPLTYLGEIIDVLLIVLLFVIGHQMRISGTKLKHVFLNKSGIKLSLSIVFSSLLAGVLVSLILKFPLNQALAMSSGFGWYTLSSIMVGSLINENYSVVSFFIDFNRELIAIIILPSLGRLFPYTMVGVCGATAMDFSLPVIKQNLSQQLVVVAISSGMILSVATPVLLPLFAKLSYL